MDSEQAFIAVPPDFLARKRLVVCGLLIDRSGSMFKFADAPRTAINEHLASIKTSERAADTMVFVATFADDVTFDVPPQPLSGISGLGHYATHGNTLLYGSVLMILEGMLELKAQAETLGIEVTLKLDVLTDGVDEPPDSQKHIDFKTPLQRLTSHALEAGAELNLFGIGFACQAIAVDIGFPPQNAIQVPATEAGINQTMRGVTARTHITMMCGKMPPPSSSR
ncbi:MAG: hypothetical protein RDU25_05610 [Patescibacteria group bacterium]|nr:hypothetical protein [Patescibacteria group bacterium]